MVDFFFPDEQMAVVIDYTVRHTKPDAWLGNPLKERVVKRALRQALPNDLDRLDELFELVKARHEYR